LELKCINPKGRLVAIPIEWWPDVIDQGFTLPPYRYYGNEGSDRILVKRPIGGLGDIVDMEPLIRGLHKEYPDCKVDVAIPSYLHAAIPGADRYYQYSIQPPDSEYRMILDINCPINVYEMLVMDHGPWKDRSTMFCNIGLVEASKPRLPYSVGQGHKWLESRGLDYRKPILGLHPYSTDPSRTWPHWREFLHLWSAQGGQSVLFTQKQTTLPLPKNMACAVNEPLQTVFDIMSALPMAVCSDSGLLHVAGAVGTPTIGLFGPTHGPTVSAWFDSITFQGPCSHGGPCYWGPRYCAGPSLVTTPCLAGIEAEAVVQLIQQTGPFPAGSKVTP